MGKQMRCPHCGNPLIVTAKVNLKGMTKTPATEEGPLEEGVVEATKAAIDARVNKSAQRRAAQNPTLGIFPEEVAAQRERFTEEGNLYEGLGQHHAKAMAQRERVLKGGGNIGTMEPEQEEKKQAGDAVVGQILSCLGNPGAADRVERI